MKKALDGIRARVGAGNCCKSCSRDGCRVYLHDVPRERVIVDADKAFRAHGRQGKHCDFIVFLPGTDGRLFAAPIELKSGKVDVSDAVQQLQEGSTFAERFVTQEPEVVCRPILFHGRAIHPNERRALNRKKVVFRGVELTVKTKSCGRRRNLMDGLGR